MKNKIGWTLYHTIIFCLEILFFYGLSVNLSMFYDGMTSAWISLFTWMTMSGALGLQVLLELLIENKNDDEKIKQISMIVISCILSIIVSISDIRIGGILLLCNLLNCYLRYKNKNQIYSLCLFVGSMILWNEAYLFQWITFSKYLFFLCIETTFLFQYMKKEEQIIFHSKNKKEIMIQTSIQCIKNGCILGIFIIFALAMIQIHQEGTLFYFKHILIYYALLGGGLLLSVLLNHKYKHTSISQRIAFGISMFVISMWLMKKSLLLGSVILLVCASFIALETLLDQFGKQMKMDCMSRLLLCVVLLITQNVYDGIYVNYQVVFLVIYMMIGIVMIISGFHETACE